MKWIRIEKQLPTDKQICVLFDGTYVFIGTWYEKDSHFWTFMGAHSDDCCCGDVHVDLKHVTHWKPVEDIHKPSAYDDYEIDCKDLSPMMHEIIKCKCKDKNEMD